MVKTGVFSVTSPIQPFYAYSQTHPDNQWQAPSHLFVSIWYMGQSQGFLWVIYPNESHSLFILKKIPVGGFKNIHSKFVSHSRELKPLSDK